MIDDDGAADPQEEPGEDDEPDDRIELTPEQKERLLLAMSNFPMPKVTMPESLVKNIADVSGIVDAHGSLFSASVKTMLDAEAVWRKQLSASITSGALTNIGQITGQLSKNIDFSGIAQSLEIVAKINTSFAAQQAALFKNLAPALEALNAAFYPPNLRAIDSLKFEDVDTVVMTDGIPLYGLPRTATAKALIRAESGGKRRNILGRRWRTISADCREAVSGCSSKPVAPYVPFAVAALDALDAGYTEAAQALAGSLVDTIVAGYFGDERYRYTPNKKTTTTGAYDEFTVREYIAFAPMWQTYQQFFVTNGDKVPTRFSRHATAHAVSARQYSRRNAVQALMFACSLLYRLDEEADR